MDNLVSFVLGGVILIIIYIFYQTFRKPNLLSFFFKLRFTNLKKIYPQLIILILLSTILSFVIFLNTSYANNASNQVSDHLGPTDSVIYLRDKNSSFSASKAAELFSKSSKYYDKYLPLGVLELDKIQTNKNEFNNIILVNYNLLTSQTYLKSDDFEQFDENQTIISQSLSNTLGVKEGDSITFNYDDKNYNLKIDKVIPDNGLIGYDFTIPSRLKQYNGSIYIPQNKFLEISGYKKDSPFNQVLLQSLDDRFTNDTNHQTEQDLISEDRNLVLENVKLPYLQRILGNFEGLNISQIILLLFIIPAITLIILQLYFDRKYLNDSEIKIGTLKVQGFSNSEIQGVLNYLILYKSIISSLIGLILGLLLVQIIGNNNFFQTFGLKNLPLISFNFNNILFTFSSIFIVIYLINNIWSYWNSTILIRLKYFYQIQTQKAFKLRNHTLALMIIFSTVITVYYLNSDFVTDSNIRFIGNFYILQIFLLTISYILSKYLLNNQKLISRVSLVIIFLLNTLPLTIFKSQFDINPVLSAVTWIVLIATTIIIFFILIDIVIKSIQFTQITAPKTLIFANGFIDKFKKEVLIFIVIIEFFLLLFSFTNYLSVQIIQAQKKSPSNYDIYITDEIGRTRINEINSILKKHTEISSFSFLANGNAIFDGLKIEDLKNYDKDKYPNLNPEATVSDYVGFVSDDAFSQYRFDQRDNFFSTNKYFLLTKNYKDSDRLSINLSKGEKLILSINGIKIQREFLGYIDSAETIPNGIYLSQIDYEDLHRNQNLNLNQNYAYNFSKDIDNLESLKSDLSNIGVSSVLIRNELVNGTLEITRQIVLSFNIFLWVAIIVLSIINYLIYNEMILSNISTNYTNFSQQIYGVRYTYTVIVSIIILILLSLNFYIFPILIGIIHNNIVISYLPEQTFDLNRFSIIQTSLTVILITLLVNFILTNIKQKPYERKR